MITTAVRGKRLKFTANTFLDEDGAPIVPTSVTLHYRQMGSCVDVAMAPDGADFVYNLNTDTLVRGKLYYSIEAEDVLGAAVREDGELLLTGNIANAC